jgi:hypothetical protein
LKQVGILAFSALPFDSWAAGESQAVRGIKDRKQQFRRRYYSKYFD